MISSFIQSLKKLFGSEPKKPVEAVQEVPYKVEPPVETKPVEEKPVETPPALVVVTPDPEAEKTAPVIRGRAKSSKKPAKEKTATEQPKSKKASTQEKKPKAAQSEGVSTATNKKSRKTK